MFNALRSRCALAAALSAGLLVPMFTSSQAAHAQLSTQVFSGYSTGTVVHADALQAAAAGPRLVDGEEAFSGASTNSATLAKGVVNEMSQGVSPPLATKDSYG